MNARLAEYKHKCKVLKQIQSEKALFFKRVNNIQNVLTISISAFITFIGFSGKEKIVEFLSFSLTPEKATWINTNNIEFIYNILVFVLFFEMILHLIFQCGVKQFESERAVQLLSSLINEIDDLLLGISKPINVKTLEMINYKYTSITQIIPSNTDSEYKKAKKKISTPKPNSFSIYGTNYLTMSKKEQEKFIIGLIENNNSVHSILSILRDENKNLYLGGGIIRNIIWDFLHGFTDPTPIDDVDVIYYDAQNTDKAFDIKIEENLKSIKPNTLWSVKNQGRMHIANNEQPYASLEDALIKFPETVSAILVKLNDDNSYEFIAPFGYDDLFRLIVRPTPHFMSKLDKYRDRINKKNWKQNWSHLEMFYI